VFSWALPKLAGELVALAASVATAVLCALVLAHSLDHRIVYWFGGWHPQHGLALGISFTVDGIGAGAALLAAVLVTASLVYSPAYLEQTVEHRYPILMLVFLGAMVGFCLTGDLFDMFVFLELMSVAAFALTGFRIQDPGPLQGAFNFGILVSLGSLSFLLGVALVYARTGGLNLAQIGRSLAGERPDGLVVVAFTLMVAGLFVKAGVVPFHFWLSDAYAVVPIPVGVLFAGVFGELGLYGVARIYWTAFDGTLGGHASGVRAVLMGFGVATAVVGAAMCFAQQHLKRLLAFSTVSHIGLFLVGLGLLSHSALAGVAIYVAGHAMVKGSLFLLCGILVYRLGEVDEVDLRGRCRKLAATGVLFAVGGLALAEVPPFATFLGKALVEDAGTRLGYWWMPLLFAGTSAVVGGAVLRAAGRMFLGWGPREADRFAADVAGEHEGPGETRPRHPARTPALLMAPIVALMAGGLALGLVPGLPGPVDRAAAAFQDREAYGAATLEGRTPSPPGVEAEPPSTASVWYGLGSAAAAGGLAAFAWLRRRLVPARVRRQVVAVAGVPFRRFRALQSGHAGDYTAWFVAGLATLGVLFAAVTR